MNCEIVRDLIPMYVDSTASKETDRALKRHIKKCPECAAYAAACRRADEKSRDLMYGSEMAKHMKREKSGDITDLDRHFAGLSRKLKMQKIRNTVISVFVVLGLVIYVVSDIVEALKRNDKK